MADRPVEARQQTHQSDEHPIVIDAKRAKSARKGLPVLYVLVASSALVVIAFAIIYFIFFRAVR